MYTTFCLQLINTTSVRCQGNETDSFVPFSLGVILYTMLCQRSPFFDTNHEEPGARIDIKCKEFERLGVDAQDYLKGSVLCKINLKLNKLTVFLF